MECTQRSDNKYRYRCRLAGLSASQLMMSREVSPLSCVKLTQFVRIPANMVDIS